MNIINDTLFLEDISVETLMQEYGSPLYVYEESVLRSQFRQLSSGFPEGLLEIHYSMKANSNPSLLKILREEGSSIDAVSEFEVRLALESGFEPHQIIFTGNINSLAEIEYCVEQEVSVNLGSLVLLENLVNDFHRQAYLCGSTLELVLVITNTVSPVVRIQNLEFITIKSMLHLHWQQNIN